jgi:hypothetical protein
MSFTDSKTNTTNPSIACFYQVISLSKKSNFLAEETGIQFPQLKSNPIEYTSSAAILKRKKGNR